MPDARDTNAHYHIVDEGVEVTTPNASTHAKKGGASLVLRSFDETTAHVSGPLSPGVWQITFFRATGISGAIQFAQGFTAALATPTAATSAFVPIDVGFFASLTFNVIVTKQQPFIGFISSVDTLTTNVLYTIRLLHGQN